jgi:chromosome segregation protein
VYLKSITLKGFKSFPDRTKLEFGPGVSVVVGPNGSGKSNVTDAVLWALGEQSPLAVRGQSMQDVIFAGAPGRQAAKGAEVELLLDDAEGVLDVAVPEVSIVRRLERTGEGEYRLAGARCRLVDVLEVLSDTGLGREMHSVISQGRVESIVTSKPRERRLLIEEAAGVGKHRKRRRRTQLKLTRTQDNLDRALDVEHVARSRLRPLKRQAEAAELHARLERQSLEAQWELARDDLRAALLARDQAQGVAVEARVRRGAVERQLEEIANRRQAAEEALARRSAQREELSRRCFAAQSAIERISYRRETAIAAATATGARLERARERLGRLWSLPAAKPGDAGADQRIAALEASLAALDRERDAEVAREVAQLEQQRTDAATLVRERSAIADELYRLRSGAEEQFERALAQVRRAELAVEATRREAARLNAELAAVNQFLSAQRTSAEGGGPTLAEQLEADPGYELALAAALDGRLRAAVAADRSAAGTILDRSGADGGHALVAGGSPRPAGGGASSAPTDDAERLDSHVRGRAGAVALARALLGDTWVVRSLEQVPESFTGVAVTCGGRVWAPLTRELRQAPAPGEERVLAQRNKREQLLRAASAAGEAERAADTAMEQTASEATAAEEQREQAIAAHREAVQSRDEAMEEGRRIAQLIERRRAAPEESTIAARRLELTTQLSAERAALAQAERERRERETQLERVRAAVARDEAVLPAVRTVIDALEDAGAAICERLAEFETALAADREAGEHLTGELRECAQQEAALHARLHHENETLTETEVRLQRLSDQAADAEHELGELAGQLELAADAGTEPLSEEERETLTSRIARLARRREQLGPVNPLAQQEYSSALEHVEELEHQRTDLEAALRELEKLIGDTDRQIREKFEQTFAAAARNFEQVVAELFPGGHGRLRLVSENPAPARVLGGAPRAGGEPSAEEREDTDLAGTETGEDLLGVEIEITPAGKEMKRLSLLSGGEKSLTALAFLFAVFLARPCPFYILDEVEAALDDLNIDRFLALLRTYSAHAQFIVVTHQKRTMEAADSLYGVSMGADGVSKVISRRLPQEQAA